MNVFENLGAECAEEFAKLTGAQVEARAEFRDAARVMFELYVSFTDSGFTENQALTLLSNMAKSGQQ